MILFRPLIRYADFKGRASRGEYWGFAFVQGFWYALLIGLLTLSMGHSDTGKAANGVLIAFGLICISIIGLIIPNYAVLVRRLHDSGRGAVWLCLLLPSILSSIMAIGTIASAIGAVGLGASRETFVGTVLTGLGAAGLLGLAGILCQMMLTVLTTLPGTRGANSFGQDPRDPTHRYDRSGASPLDEDRLDALFAEARRANSDGEHPHKPVFDFGPGAGHPALAPARPVPVDWGRAPPSRGITPAPVFGRRRS